MNYLHQWTWAATIRALKTAAQTAVGVIGTAAVMGDVAWPMVLSAAGLAAVVSLLTSVAGVPEVDGGASLAAIAHGEEGPEDGPHDEGEGQDA